MQTIIVAVIVLVAAVLVARRLYRTFRSGGTEGCGCSSCTQCDVQSACDLEQNKHTEER